MGTTTAENRVAGVLEGLSPAAARYLRKRYVDASSAAATLRSLEESGRISITHKRKNSWAIERLVGGGRVSADEHVLEKEIFRKGPKATLAKAGPLRKAVKAQTKALSMRYEDAFARPNARQLRPWAIGATIVVLGWIALALTTESAVARGAVSMVVAATCLGKWGGTWKDALRFTAGALPLAAGFVSFFGFAAVFERVNPPELMFTATVVAACFGTYVFASRWSSAPTPETVTLLEALDAVRGDAVALPQSWRIALEVEEEEPLLAAVDNALQEVKRPSKSSFDDPLIGVFDAAGLSGDIDFTD